MPENNKNPRSFATKRNIIIIAAAAIILAGGATVFAVTHNAKSNSESVLTLAQRYLSEQNYKQAVIEFQKILEIDPLNAEAYLGLAEAYLGLGDTESAINALREGYEATGDESLLARLNELTGENEETELPAQTEEKPADLLGEEQNASQSYSGSEMLSNVLNSIFAADGEYDLQRLSSVEEIHFTYNYSEKFFTVNVTYLDGGSYEYKYDYEYDYEAATVLDTECLNYMSNVRFIDIRDVVLNDLSFVENTPNLVGLQVTLYGVSDLSPLPAAPNLAFVNLFWHHGSEQVDLDISPLSDLPRLSNVWLQNGCVTVSDLSPLTLLPELRYLILTVNVDDYSALEGLKLKTLTLPLSCPEETVAALRAALPDCEITLQ